MASTTQPSASALGKAQRALLATCIILAPVSVSIYVLSWAGNLRDPIAASAEAGVIGNALHFIGAIAASFFLPLGYLGMSLLGVRRAPRLASWCIALSLIGWIPWSALIGLDDLAFDIAQTGSDSQQTALWARFNGDPVMLTYLLIYIIGHLASAILIAYMLGRLRIIPAWAAWAFALTSPLTILFFVIPGLEVKNVIKLFICALWIAGAAPAALAMLQRRDERA